MKRYDLLDGLRGVAALMVIFYHIGECFALSPQSQVINHGYLAVDFFFVLSGFVLSYAYGNRLAGGMTAWNFIKKRIIRLQPMVVVGVVMGVISFLVQGCEKWDGQSVSTTAVVLSLLLGLLLIPSLPGTLPEVRGNGEMFPLNGPSWSLFFEYIGSVLYATILHRLSNKFLAAIVFVSGIALATIAIGNFSGAYHLGVGWSAADGGFWMGLARLMFSFTVGVLIHRLFVSVKIRGAFWMCSIIIVVLLSVPFVGGEDMPVLNGVYDALCTIFVFPFIVWLGASGETTDERSRKICEFLGAISYPVYIIHYPLMYLFYSWVWKNGYEFSQVWPVALLIVVASVVLAWLLLKFYDEPVRKWLGKKLK